MTASPTELDPTAVVRFPADPLAPINVSFLGVPLEVILLPKQSIPHRAGQLSKEVWGVAGVYVLLGPIGQVGEEVSYDGDGESLDENSATADLEDAVVDGVEEAPVRGVLDAPDVEAEDPLVDPVGDVGAEGDEAASIARTTPGTPIIRARPGSGDDVLHRLRDHPRENPWFTRALVARDTRRGWTGSEARFLEGRLHELCRLSPMVEHDFNMDKDRR